MSEELKKEVKSLTERVDLLSRDMRMIISLVRDGKAEDHRVSRHAEDVKKIEEIVSGWESVGAVDGKNFLLTVK